MIKRIPINLDSILYLSEGERLRLCPGTYSSGEKIWFTTPRMRQEIGPIYSGEMEANDRRPFSGIVWLYDESGSLLYRVQLEEEKCSIDQ